MRQKQVVTARMKQLLVSTTLLAVLHSAWAWACLVYLQDTTGRTTAALDLVDFVVSVRCLLTLGDVLEITRMWGSSTVGQWIDSQCLFLMLLSCLKTVLTGWMAFGNSGLVPVLVTDPATVAHTSIFLALFCAWNAGTTLWISSPLTHLETGSL